VLARTVDDGSRFQDARGLKAYAGAAPITRVSGETRSVLHRRVKNQRLAAGLHLSLLGPHRPHPAPGARQQVRAAPGS
jgi:hypothetical protein